MICKQHQLRINTIYEIGQVWESKCIGLLGSYLHKPLGPENMSLFNLLKADSLNLTEVYRYLDSIAEAVLNKRQKDAAYEVLLQKHSFASVSKEDMEDRLDDINYLG